MVIATAMVKIVAAIILGYFLYKIHILNEQVDGTISQLVIYAAGPCMIFSSIMDLDRGNEAEILRLIISGFGIYILFAVLAFLGAKLLRPGKSRQGAYEAILMFGNTAFLAFPIGEALMGSVGVSYLAILNVFQTVLAFSYGIFLLTKGNAGTFKFTPKKLISPGNISAVIAIIMYFAGVKLPDLVMAPIDFIGQLTSPLAMLVIGGTIAGYSLKSLFNNWRYYAAALMKLIVFPLIAFFIARAVWGPGDLARVITIHCAMPTAVIITMIAVTYKADYETTSSATGLMDILCIGTIPLVWAVISSFM